jgi:dolichol-phosphate mannosyltransferase
MSGDRLPVLIPTYNEIDNVVGLYENLRHLGLGLDILFIDDASPDGTGAVLDDLSGRDQGLHVIHRKNKAGIGSAHKDGIAWAYAKGYKILVTMDSDYAHSPGDIERFLELGVDHDLVVGTRFARANSMGDLSLTRRFLSSTAHFMTQYCLRMPYDSTNAFRLYRLDRIPEDLFKKVASDSYSFFFESLFIFHSNGVLIREVPISLSIASCIDMLEAPE